jgi:hypothetical protein
MALALIIDGVARTNSEIHRHSCPPIDWDDLQVWDDRA